MPVSPRQSVRISWALASCDRNLSEVDELTPEERLDFDLLPHDARRRDWLAGRRAAKRAIATHADSGAAPASVSISHCDGHGLAAVADHPNRIGVDLEREGEIDLAHRRYFLAPAEWAIADRVGATVVWTLKEAAWKALALTDETPFSALRLAVDHQGELRGLWLHGDWIPATARTWRLSNDYVAAVVFVGAVRE
jgi:4'-phosphopantetheinyl transferase EntD